MRRRAFRGQRGQAIIEFLIVFPLMALLLFAIVDFGLALYQRHVLINAVSDAATIAARDRDSDRDSVEDDLVDFAHGYLSQADADGAFIQLPCGIDRPLIVEVNKEYELVSPLQGMLDMLDPGGAPTIEIDLKAKKETKRTVPCS
jgi:Flp pilus assembly protein TadG